MTRPQTPLPRIRYLALLLIGLPAVVGAASGPKKLPVCDGKHLRDVNIYGSVLPGSPIPAIVAPPPVPPVPKIETDTVGAPPPPVPAAPATKTSARDVPRNVRSC